MTRISNNKAKIGKGQKVKLGSNNAYEVYQNPVSGQLEIIDTENNSRALVDKEDRGQIGGNGTFIKALKNGEPMADTGKTYSTVRGAIDAANSRVFIPPKTYSLSKGIQVHTDGLTIAGAGYNSYIKGGSTAALQIFADDVTIQDLRISTDSNGFAGIANKSSSSNTVIQKCRVEAGRNAIKVGPSSTIRENIIKDFNKSNNSFSPGIVLSDGSTVANNLILDGNGRGIYSPAEDVIISNNSIKNVSLDGIVADGPDNVISGNRIHNVDRAGIRVSGNNDAPRCIVANNRISNSSTSNIVDGSSNAVIEGNLTGGAN